MLAKITQAIEMVGLQIGVCRVDIRHRRLDQNIGGDIFDGRIRDFMDEADIPVFAGRDPGDDLAPCDFGIDDRLAATAAVIDHHDKILHAGDLGLSPDAGTECQYFGKSEVGQVQNSEKQKLL